MPHQVLLRSVESAATGCPEHFWQDPGGYRRLDEPRTLTACNEIDPAKLSRAHWGTTADSGNNEIEVLHNLGDGSMLKSGRPMKRTQIAGLRFLDAACCVRD